MRISFNPSALGFNGHHDGFRLSLRLHALRRPTKERAEIESFALWGLFEIFEPSEIEQVANESIERCRFFAGCRDISGLFFRRVGKSFFESLEISAQRKER